MEFSKLFSCIQRSFVQVGYTVSILSKLNDILSSIAVTDALHNNTIPDDNDQVEKDKEAQDAQHDIAKDLVCFIIYPLKRSLEHK